MIGMRLRTYRLRLCAAIIAAVTGVAAAIPVQAFEFAVSPMRVEFELGNRPVTRALKIVNHSNRRMELSIRVANFDMDEANKVREIAPTAQSMDQWIIVRPLKVALDAGQTRTIRFAVRPYVKPKPGEHRAMIFIASENPREKNGKLDIGFRFGVAVYGSVGKISRVATLHGVEAKPKSIALDISSHGNAATRFLGSYGIWKSKAFPGTEAAAARLELRKFRVKQNYKPDGAIAARPVPALPVFPGTRRQVVAEVDGKLAPGKYTVLVAGRLGSQAIQRTVSLTVEK